MAACLRPFLALLKMVTIQEDSRSLISTVNTSEVQPLQGPIRARTKLHSKLARIRGSGFSGMARFS